MERRPYGLGIMADWPAWAIRTRVPNGGGNE